MDVLLSFEEAMDGDSGYNCDEKQGKVKKTLGVS